jgi:DNA gyrase subunit A
MDFGKIQPVEITHEMQKSYLDYAMSVIVARALPDVRDGMKPVHRRILFAMNQLGLTSGAHFAKSAKIVGEVMGKYHPHGDSPIYEALVRLAQDFSMRYPLVHGQGNFGSVDGDSAAAMRYTEAKLAKIADEMLSDIDKETVPQIFNFDSTLLEPVYLPAKLPNLLLMGSEGIAVGMATKIPPHNLGEVSDAISYMIDNGKMVAAQPETDLGFKKIDLDGQDKIEGQIPLVFESDIATSDLMKFIKGPDFPTAGEIYDAQQLTEVYSTGRGRIVIRGKAEIEETKAGKFQIIIAEIPFQVNKAELVKKIASLVKDKKLDGISDLRDESDRHGIRVVVELKRDAKPKSVLNNLYKLTSLQTVFSANFVALVDGTPMTLNLKQILTYYISHRHEIITKRSLFDLKAAKARAHILEGLLIALDNLDEVIATIRKSEDAEDAKTNLVAKFKLTEIQAVAILDMQLRKLAHLERQKIEDEYKAIMETIAFLEDLLAHPEKVLKVIQKELSELREKFADERKTKVYPQQLGEFSEEDLVPKEEAIITVTNSGYIKRVPRTTFRIQRRGGKGVMGMTTKEEDEIAQILTASTHDNILFFTDKGRVFQLRVWDLPEGSRQAKGQAIINLINIETGEKVQSILTTSTSEKDMQKFLLLVTSNGTVKKTPLLDYKNIRLSGLIAIKLVTGDSLCWAHVTTGDDHVLLISHDGKSIKFSEKDIRPTARDTMGVRGILLKSDDYVVGMEVFASSMTEPDDKRKKFFRDILVIMERGIGKRTDLTEWPLQKRGGVGVKVAEVTPKTGKVACARMVSEDIDQVVMTSRMAQIIKLPLRNIPKLGRATQGVILMRFGAPNDTVAGVTCLEKEGDTEES